MSDKPEPLDELKTIFEEAAAVARKAWESAHARNEAAKQENEMYRELAGYGSAALDVLNRAIRQAWGNTEKK